MSEKIIDEVMGLVECYGGMKQNSGIECANKEEADFYESVASDHLESIRAKLREVLERKPLTVEQIAEIDDQVLQEPPFKKRRIGYCERFARAIERAHGITQSITSTEETGK